jgi:hypothetical protein
MFASAPPRRAAGLPWLEPGHSRRGPRRRRRRRPTTAWLAPLALVAVVAGGVAILVRHNDRVTRERQDAARYARAWVARDSAAMWEALATQSQQAYPLDRFRRLVAQADHAATVSRVRLGRAADPKGGAVVIPVAVDTRLYGTLRGRIRLAVAGGGGVQWTPELRLPGVRPGEAIASRKLQDSKPASVLTSDGRQLQDDPVLAPFFPGLQRRFRSRLTGRPGAELRFGRRIVARVAPQPGRSVRSSLRPALQRVAQQALGNRLGGVAVLRPSDGSVLALAGIAVSAPQPPGSTFKIITLSAALAAGVASPSSTFPVTTSATLSGFKLANANNESCGGSLVTSFAKSCNSVFAPLGARVGAQKLVARAEAFGFNETPRVPVAKPSTIPAASQLRDALAVGASAIGQNKDLATPLAMASVAAAIGEHGMRAKPRAVMSDPVQRRRAVSARVAQQVKDMMIAVVQSGTGTSAALPGVQVAGKTGTAELRYTGSGTPDPRNTDAWFVAFAPASNPRVAVGVMLVGAGYGGDSAAPIARQVLAAALR